VGSRAEHRYERRSARRAIGLSSRRVHRDRMCAPCRRAMARDRLADHQVEYVENLKALAVIELLGRAARGRACPPGSGSKERQAMVDGVLAIDTTRRRWTRPFLCFGIEVAALDPLWEVDLLMRGQQPDPCRCP